MSKGFHWGARLKSFTYAFSGIFILLRSQHNAWIHAAATVIVCAMGFWLRLSSAEWCWLVLAMTVVWMAEAMNTAVEFLADVISPEFHILVKYAKDVAAGAVLLAAMGALIIGLLVMGPHLLAKSY